MADLIGMMQAAAGAGGDNLYIEDVFSTYLYTGNGSTRTIQNGINLGTNYAGPSLEFDGVNDFLSRASDLSGNADGKQVTFSAWIHPKVTGSWTIYSNDIEGGLGAKFTVYGNPDQLLFVGRNSGGTNVVYAEITSVGFMSPGRWYHILISFDLSNASNRYVYLNDSPLSMTWNTYTNADIDFTNSTHYIGDRVSGGYRLQSYLSNVFLDYVYRDISVEANRRLFITSGLTPATNQQSLSPIMYLPMTTSAGSNLGTGGDFTVNGNPQIDDNFGPYTADSAEGGLVWVKKRSGTQFHILQDTVRGAGNLLYSNATTASGFDAASATTFTATGFTTGSDNNVNASGQTYASWTFRKAPKFFDVVTYTGDNTSNRQIAHNLGSAPGFIVIKKTSGLEDWVCYHRVDGSSPTGIKLNSDSSSAGVYYTNWFNGTPPTDSVFTISDGNDLGPVNASGSDYVAYLFAHDAGGFGDDGQQNVISCGSYTGNGSTTGPVITLGYEPQWLMVKKSSGTGDWVMLDNMRGIVTDKIDRRVWANLSNAENTGDNLFKLNATGFQPESLSDSINASGATYIYIAIRRGPMKTPEAGTEVFDVQIVPVNSSHSSYPSTPVIDTTFPLDFLILKERTGSITSWVDNRLTQKMLQANTNDPQLNTATEFDYNNGYRISITNSNCASYAFKRAPGFFDIVAYTGTGVNRTVTHNLGVVPELMLVKNRIDVDNWFVYHAALGNLKALTLNNDSIGGASSAYWNNTAPTSTNFSVGIDNGTNGSSDGIIAYLFATLAGISKVGSYTGTGTTLQVDCGFSAGARFVFIKRTDSSGDWYVWDTTRGIIAGNDPFLLLNSTAAENTSTDYIDPLASGFEISSTAPAAINASGGTFIFLAIA